MTFPVNSSTYAGLSSSKASPSPSVTTNRSLSSGSVTRSSRSSRRCAVIAPSTASRLSPARDQSSASISARRPANWARVRNSSRTALRTAVASVPDGGISSAPAASSAFGTRSATPLITVMASIGSGRTGASATPVFTDSTRASEPRSLRRLRPRVCAVPPNPSHRVASGRRRGTDGGGALSWESSSWEASGSASFDTGGESGDGRRSGHRVELWRSRCGAVVRKSARSSTAARARIASNSPPLVTGVRRGRASIGGTRCRGT